MICSKGSPRSGACAGSFPAISPGRTAGITRYASGCSKYASIHSPTRAKSSRKALPCFIMVAEELAKQTAKPRGRRKHASMKYRTYPNSDVTVSEIGFGLWTTATGWWGEKTDEDAVAMLREAYDLGITLYDAADTYGNGRSEEQLAKAFSERRDSVVYATKFGYDFANPENQEKRRGQFELPQDFSPPFVRKALEASLARMNTDYVDIYQIHNARLAQIEDDAL